MFYTILYILILSCSTIFTFMIHPLAMGIMLLIQTLMISLISGLMTKSFWFSYILFLIFLGGMLILFMYVASLASNEMFNFSMKILSLNFITMIFLLILMLFLDKMTLMNYQMTNETKNLITMNMYMLENSLALNKLYNLPINLVTIMLMIYLFLTLIAIVKITNVFEGPLRPKF